MSNTAEMSTERAKKLEIVRALLAKADGTNFPEEADAFRRKADQLMTAFAIEQWQVVQAQDGVYTRPKPEIRSMDFSWWVKSSHYQALWSMFCEVATHCRCVVAMRGESYGKMPVIGIPSDLDYFDMLFTHLMLQMGMQLEPKPDPAKSFEENAYVLRISGTNKLRVAKLIHDAGLTPSDITPDEGFPGYLSRYSTDAPSGKYGKLNYTPATKKLLRKLRAASEKWAKDNNLSTTVIGTGTTGTTVWQRSFARGFVAEIGDRLWAMRKPEPQSDGASVAIALRDIRQMAVELYEETWPRPEPCEDCEAGTCKKHKGRKLAAVRYDSRAVNAGRTAGQQADISGHQDKRVGKQRELPR